MYHILPLLLMFTIFSSNAFCSPERDYTVTGVKIVVPLNWPPYSYADLTGQPQGYTIDFWEKWSDKSGIPVTFQLLPWPKTIESIKSGECDIHGGILKNSERETYLSFSSPIHPSKGALVAKDEPKGDIKDILAMSTVGVLRNSYEEFYVRTQYPQTKRRPFDSNPKLFDALQKGEIQAAIVDLTALLSEHTKKGWVEGVNVIKVVYETPIHGAVLKGNSPLLQLINDGASQITETERQYLANKWFINDSDGNPKTDRDVLFGGVAVITMLIAAVVLTFNSRRS